MRLLPALLLALLLAACGSTPDPVAAPAGSPLWYSIDNRVGLLPEEIESLTMAMESELGPSRVAPGTAGAQHLRVVVTSFRWVEDKPRQGEGLVAGSDHVASTVQRVDPATSAVLAEKRVVTPAAKTHATVHEMLQRHAADVAQFAAGR